MNNYYTDELNEYNSNYDDAVVRIDGMITKLQTLYDSFNGANGDDIINIRTDIKSLISKLKDIKASITSKKDITNKRAKEYNAMLNSWIGRIGKNYDNPVEAPPTPTDNSFKTINYRTRYEIIDDVSVSDRGYINVKVKSYIENEDKDVASNTSKKTIEDVSYKTYEHGFNGYDDYV